MPFSAISTTWPLLLGMGVLMLGAGLQSTLLGVRATLEGFPTVVTGIIMSCYYVGYVLGTMIAPPLLRQVGHIRVFAALAAVASVAILVQGCFVDPWRGAPCAWSRDCASPAFTWSPKAGSTIAPAARIAAGCSPCTCWCCTAASARHSSC